MRRALAAVIVVCGLHVAASLAWAAGHPPAPRAFYTPSPAVLKEAPCDLTTTEPDFDWGLVHQGATARHTFTVTNSGKAPLRIGHVETSCGCTAALVSRPDLAPGASAQVDVTFKGGQLNGPFHKTVRLSVEPGGTLVLGVRGRILSDYLPDPVAVSFGPLKPGQRVVRSVVFYPTWPSSKWEFGPPYTMDRDVIATDPKPEGPGYRVEVALTGRVPGPKAGVLTLPGKIPLFVRFTGQVTP